MISASRTQFAAISGCLLLVMAGGAAGQGFPASFSRADINSDGKLSPTEFGNTPRARIYGAESFGRADVNGDGFLSSEEFAAPSGATTAPNGQFDVRLFNFDAADTDKDGKLSRAEYAATPRASSIRNAEDGFNFSDRDDDGFINREEFVAPMADGRPQTPKAPFPYRSEDVSYINAAAEGVRLAGTLTLPEGRGPFPAVFLITGSGAQDRDESIAGHKPFAVIADHLTRKGIAVLRVDDRGVGGSTGSMTRVTGEDLAGDVRAGLAYLRTRPEVDARRIGVIGHSEGGVLAPMVAAGPNAPAFQVLLAAPAVTGEALIVEQQRQVATVAGLPSAQVEITNAMQAQLMAAVVASQSETDAFEIVVRTLTAMGAPQDQAQSQARMISSPMYRWMLAHNPAEPLKTVQTPVLALYGAKDVQVPAQQNQPAMTAALAGNPRATVETLPGLNHLFQTAETGNPEDYPYIQETFAPAALERMSSWILSLN